MKAYLAFVTYYPSRSPSLLPSLPPQFDTGFPEFWYSWRNQLHFLGTHGFHAVALDMRGYGWTEKPTGREGGREGGKEEGKICNFSSMPHQLCSPSSLISSLMMPHQLSSPSSLVSSLMIEIEAYNLEVLVRDVREVIDALGYGPKEDGKEGRGCVLVGHDWGGTVAWAAAHVLGPSVIKGLSVMNCPHPKVYMEQATMAQFLKSWYFYCA